MELPHQLAAVGNVLRCFPLIPGRARITVFHMHVYWSGISKPFATWQDWVINQELNYTEVSIRAFKTTDIPICAMLKIIGLLFSFSSFIHHILIGRSREWFCKILKLCFGVEHIFTHCCSQCPFRLDIMKCC